MILLRIIENKGLFWRVVLLLVGILDLLVIRKRLLREKKYEEQEGTLRQEISPEFLGKVILYINITGFLCIVVGLYLLYNNYL